MTAASVVRALEDEGIPFTFGIPGTHNIELYDALGPSRVQPILVTDEQSAAFMADGLWRAAGLLGCVNLVPGAGLTHALSGIAEAWQDGIPMLVLSCGIRQDSARAWQLHDVDQLAIAAPVVKATMRVERAEDAYPTIREACALARAGTPGPVMVEVPVDLYLAGGRLAPGTMRAKPGPPEPAEAELTAALKILRDARPLLYVGLGAAGAAADLVSLAERLGAPVATSISGKGVFPEDHPLFLWNGLGRTAPPFVRDVVADRGSMLAIGCRFSEVGTGSWGFEPPGPLVHVDINPSVPGRNYPAALAVVADSARFVQAMLPRLPETGPDTLELTRRIRAGHEQVMEQAQSESDPARVNPARLLGALQEALGPRTIFAADSGNGTFLAMELLRLAGPGRFLAPVDYSCMGYSVPAAIGAALGRPDAPVVALAGDGAFLMTGLEALTAANHRVPVAIFVLRDRELAQIAQFQNTAFHRQVASSLPDYHLAGLAAGLGIEFASLNHNDGIPAVLAQVRAAMADRRPILIETAIDYSRKTWFTRGVVRTTFARLPWKDRLRFVARAVGRRLGG